MELLRRFVLLVCCFLLTLTASRVQATPQAETIQEQVNLTWFAPLGAGPELELWKSLIPQFESKNPGTKVELSVEPWADYWQKIAVMFAGGVHPDLCWMHASYFKDYAEAKILRDLGDLVSADKEFKLEDFVDIVVDEFRHKGRLYGLPKDHGGAAVWYNADMFDAAGVRLPFFGWTWTDFLVSAKKLTKDINGDGQTDQWGTTDLMAGGNPASWYHQQPWRHAIKSFGADTYSSDLKETWIDKEETIEAIQFMADAVNKHGIAPKAEQVAGLGPAFRIGKAAMSTFPHAAEGYFIRYEKRPVKRYGVEFIPKGKGNIVYGVGCTGFSIPTGSKHPKQAWAFAKFGVSKEVGELVAQHYRWGACRKDQWALRFELQEKNGIQIEENWRRVWVDSVLKPGELGITPGHNLVPAGVGQINTILKTEFDPVYMGKRTARDAALAAKPKIQALLDKVYSK